MASERLLALIIGSGQKGQSAEAMASQLLSKYGGLASLSQAQLPELIEIPGIGTALAARLVASFQLGRRALCNLPPPLRVRGPQDVHSLLAERLIALPQELFIALALDVRGRIIEEIEVARGSLAGVEVHARDLFRPLIRASAFACILVHNHPSGDPTPSDEDRNITDRMAAAGALLGIEVLDHIVIAKDGIASMADRLQLMRMGEDYM